MAATTYPGTVTPIRGLTPFSESERDVLFGRDGERDDIAKLLTADGFRAGLLYGEAGVGKTSLLRAGLIPHLRDHGVIALPCDDLRDPAASFARAAHHNTGLPPGEGEPPLNYLARIVSQALAGQQYVFILDDVDVILHRGPDAVVNQLADLFARVVTRSGGRARFLFCCTSEHMHRFGVLKRRTGSLFPPLSRYELLRLSPPIAAMILERTLALAGSSTDRVVAQAIAEGLGHRGSVLPADLQLGVLALGELGITSVEGVRRVGGATELERAWLTRIAAATGNERAALRLLAELAGGDGETVLSPEWAASRAGVERGFSQHAFAALADKGVIVPVPADGDTAAGYQLVHPVLAARVREIAAPARASAHRAYELIGSKAAVGARLSAREYTEVWRENITPSTPEESAVLARTKRFFVIVAAVAAIAPVVLLILVWTSLASSYYLDAGPREQVVVRRGRPWLRAFHWLPASPGYGAIIADPGVVRSMLRAGAWQQVIDRDVVGELGGDRYASAVEALLGSELQALYGYARTGDEAALDVLFPGEQPAAERIARLAMLAPIARGGVRETLLVEKALSEPSAAVQAAALAVAAQAAARKPGAYESVLTTALTSDDPQLRHLGFSAARSLGEPAAATLFQSALRAEPGEFARAELLAAVTTQANGDAPSAASAASILGNASIAPANRRRAERMLRLAFAGSPADASRAAVELVSDHRAPDAPRLLAMQLIDEYAPAEVLPELAPALKLALQSASEPVRAAAWPLFARASPNEAARELVGLGELPEPMRVAAALAWGELARSDEPAARPALEPYLADPSPGVRAAAARAFGFVGGSAQPQLATMVDKERFDVAEGAAFGLANSVEVGGSVSDALGGIRTLWKKKGRTKRVAAEVFARIAKSKPGPVYSYLNAAARESDDTDLRLIGVRGLCAGVANGHRSSGAALRKAASDVSTDVRRAVAECAVAHVGNEPSLAADIAESLMDDVDPGNRADAARVLTRVAGGEQERAAAAAGRALVRLTNDDDREVRMLAARGLRERGRKAPDEAAAALQRAFERRDADDGEKLELLGAARAVGASAVVPLGLSDPAPSVRIAALDGAMRGKNVGAALNAALSDSDSSVRRAALEKVAARAEQLDQAAVSDALALATRDPDPTIAAAGLRTLATALPPEDVVARLRGELASPSERVRARAAAAAAGLIDRDPAAAVSVLEPLLDDPSRDVRAAALAPLARAWSATREPAALGSVLRGAEAHPTVRLVAAGALFTSGSIQVLERLANDGPPLARHTAALTRGLIDGGVDGLAFLAELVR